jgi:hypothetical protein
MSIGEDGDPIRRERFDGLLHAATHAALGLPGETDHEVDVHAFDAGRAQLIGRRNADVERLDPVHRRLDGGIEVLHADAGAAEPEPAERPREFRRQSPRVDLDRKLGCVIEIQQGACFVGDPSQRLAAERGRRAAAPVDVSHPARIGQMTPDEVQFANEKVRIGAGDLRFAQHRGGAAAEPAEPTAERDVEVQRQIGIRRNVAQPILVQRGAQRLVEMIGRGIAGVARDRPGVFQQYFVGRIWHLP